MKIFDNTIEIDNKKQINELEKISIRRKIMN